MSLRFVDPRWDLLIAPISMAAVLLAHPWPLVTLSGVLGLVLLKVRLARADSVMEVGRGSKLNHVFSWMLVVNLVTFSLVRAAINSRQQSMRQQLDNSQRKARATVPRN